MAKKTNTLKKSTTTEPSKSQYIADRLKILLKNKGLTFNELAEKIDITSNGLYLSFKRGKITISTLEKIAKVLDVHPFFFFEEEIIERLTEETRQHIDEDKLSVREFLMSVSRDLNKGMKLEQAAYKNLDSKGYTRGLLM